MDLHSVNTVQGPMRLTQHAAVYLLWVNVGSECT